MTTEFKPGDSAARADALDIQQSWIVEAPAGSGKTELLMQRFLRLLAYAEQPEEVLAITFTRKAATEMRDRILESLRDAQHNHPLDANPGHQRVTRDLAIAALKANEALQWNLTGQPQRLNIRTIDALCSEIAGRLPVLSRLGATMHPVETPTRLYRQAAQAALEEIGGDNPRLNHAIQTLLLHLENRIDQAVELIAGMLDSRDQWARVFPIAEDHTDEELDAKIHERFELPLQQNVTEVLDKTFRMLPPATWQQIFGFAHYAAHQLKNSSHKNICQDLLEIASMPPFEHQHLSRCQAIVNLLLTDKNNVRKSSGVNIRIGFAAGLPQTRQFKSLLDSLQGASELVAALSRLRELPPPEYTGQQRKVLRASFLVLRRALGHLKVTFAQTGQSDFVEIALAAGQALREDSDSLAQTFGTAIRHLLVDEMQDTSITQYEIFSSLVRGWDGHSQTVFLVGDPKQSIYRFRHVEVGLFARARREGLGEIQLKHLQLSSNFRSHQSLVAHTNQSFEKIFFRQKTDSFDPDAIEFTAARAAHREPYTERVFWHPHVVEYTEKGKPTSIRGDQDPATKEAREICDIIQHHRDETPPGEQPKSIAILIRARSHVAAILHHMRQRGIPYRAVDLDTLADRQPVLDLLALTRSLLHPHDRTAWLAVLRAPWCGLTLADLHLLCGSDDASCSDRTVAELLRARIGLLSIDGQLRASRTWRALETSLGLVSRERLSMLVERTWHTLGGAECVEPVELPAVTEFFRLLDRLEAEDALLNAARLEEQMKRLFAPSDGASDSPVEVLTLFKAKGLEWDLVLMPGLHRCPGRDGAKLLTWIEQVNKDVAERDEPPEEGASVSTVFLAPIKRSAEENEPMSAWIAARTIDRDCEELKRLFYVGCTRARQELHLFGQCKENKSGQLGKVERRSLLATAWPIAEGPFAQHLEQLRARSRSRGKVIQMPTPAGQPHTFEPAELASLAAAADEGPEDSPVNETAGVATIPLSNFRRLRSDWVASEALPDVPTVRRRSQPTTADDFQMFDRPQGSWRARVFGTAVHAFLEPLAQIFEQQSESGPQQTIQRAIEQLRLPIRLYLMRSGFQMRDAEAEAGRIGSALLQVAEDARGRWILSQHPAPVAGMAHFEIPITAIYNGAQRSIRVDRMFLAGEEPMTPGEEALWIVDFKTSHNSGDMQEFLDREQEFYADQMQTYVGTVQAAYPQHQHVRVGLYYPLLREFVWWKYGA